jgi:putative membrane protein
MEDMLEGATTQMAHPMANSAPELDTATRLAYDRTRLAYENTMMAWVRTATSLITFGFSIYKFFQFEKGGGEGVDRLVGPREFALLMITVGLVSLLLGTVHHVRSMRQLRAHDPTLPRSLAAPLGVLISLLGLVALIAVIFRQ